MSEWKHAHPENRCRALWRTPSFAAKTLGVGAGLDAGMAARGHGRARPSVNTRLQENGRRSGPHQPARFPPDVAQVGPCAEDDTRGRSCASPVRPGVTPGDRGAARRSTLGQVGAGRGTLHVEQDLLEILFACWTILRLVIEPSCFDTALVTLPSIPGSCTATNADPARVHASCHVRPVLPRDVDEALRRREALQRMAAFRVDGGRLSP